MNSTDQKAVQISLEGTRIDSDQDTTERKLTAAERVLGLVLGHIYKVDGDDQPDGRLFFLRQIEHLPTWNTGDSPNTREDLAVTFYHTPVTEINPFNGLQTAGNVYDIEDPETQGPLRINAALIDRDDIVREIPDDPTWFVQNPDTVQNLDPVPEIEDLIQYSVPSVPSP